MAALVLVGAIFFWPMIIVVAVVYAQVDHYWKKFKADRAWARREDTWPE